MITKTAILAPLAVVAGTFVEGETVLIMAGFAVHRGYMPLWVAIAAGFAGGLASDQLFFHLGRRYGRGFLDRKPRWRAAADRVDRLLARRQTLVVVGFRFWYGLRTVAPLALGTTSISGLRFLALNAAGAAVWSVGFGAAGYAFGEVLARNVKHLERYEAEVFAGLAAAGALVWLAVFLRHRRAAAA